MSVRAFPSRPDVRQTETRGEWELCVPVLVIDGRRRWFVPAGFRFDFASVPRIVRPLIQTTDLGTAAPVAHDYLYANGGVVESFRYSRAESDRLFDALMASDRVPRWRQVLAYRAVRLFGAGPWQDPASDEKRAA